MTEVECKTCYYSSHNNDDGLYSCDRRRGERHGSCHNHSKWRPCNTCDNCALDKGTCASRRRELGIFDGYCINYDKWTPALPDAPEETQVYGDGEETTDGLKYDAKKVDMSFLEYFPRSLEKVCGLSEFGARKYERGGFAKVRDPKRYKAAMLRHYFQENGEDVDPDSGFAHDVAVAWNALAALEIRLANEEAEEI